MEKTILDYTLISRQALFEHTWVQIYHDLLEHQGQKIGYFYLTSPVEAVATVGLAADQKIILTRQYRHPVGQVLFDLPAGRLNPGEDPIIGARREFEEETGFYPHHIERLGYCNQFPGMIRAATNLFFARDLQPTRQNLDEGELLEIVFKPVEEVLEMILDGQLIDGSLQLGVLLALSKGLINIQR